MVAFFLVGIVKRFSIKALSFKQILFHFVQSFDIGDSYFCLRPWMDWIKGNDLLKDTTTFQRN
jgi:hypothetical protein